MAPRDSPLCPMDNQHRPRSAPIISFQPSSCSDKKGTPEETPASRANTLSERAVPASAAIKSVRFHPSCRVKLYSMCSQNDKKQAWYSPSDYQRFKNQRKQLMEDAAAKGNGDRKEQLSLDNDILRDDADQRLAERNGAWDSVIQLQDDVSPEELGYLYGTLASLSQLTAQHTALSLEAQLWADDICSRSSTRQTRHSVTRGHYT